jgi:probable selenium-dependent hydroxylase accessory protein YqeC
MTSLRHSLNLRNGGVISLVGAGGKTALMFRLARELSKEGGRVLTTTTTKIFVPTHKQSSIMVISESADTIVHHARKLLRKHHHISAGSRLLPLKNKLQGLQPETIDALWQSGVFRWIIVEADGAAGRPLKMPAVHEPVVPQSTRWLIGVVGLSAVGKPLIDKWAFRPKLIARITGQAAGATITEEVVAAVMTDDTGILKNSPPGAMRFAFLNQADSEERLDIGRRIARILGRSEKSGLTKVLIGQMLYEPSVKLSYP